MEFRTQMLDAMHENSFVIWDTSKDEKGTLWGGVMTATAKGKGVKAACIDGGIRDTHQILDADFPIFYKHRISNGSLGRCLITHFQTALQIDDVIIKPGDVVLGDIDGVLIVPRDIAYEVLIRAEEIKENEKVIFGWVNAGETIQSITEKGGYF
jgi:regulator of RNase E activity RraA